MGSKFFVVVLALVALAAVGWLTLGREGFEKLFGLARDEAATEDGDGLDGSGSQQPSDAAGSADLERRGPMLVNSRKIARVGKGAVVGRVLDVRTAKGVAKAVVTLEGKGLADEVVAARTETSAEGSFRLADVAAGLDFAMRVEAGGLASLNLRRVVVRADGVVDLGDLWLGLPGALEGFVLDPAGEGVVGVEVQLHRGMGSLREFLQSGGFMDLFANMDREPEPLLRTTTKARGAFRFEGANAGPAALVVRAPGYKQAIVSITLTSDAGHEPVKVRLVPGATLTGKVVNEQGRGLSGVHLAAFSEDGGMPSPLSRTFTESTADGTFRFTSLAGEGKLMVVGAAQGFPNAFTQANAGDTDVRVVLRRGATLDVRVVSDAGDEPIVGAQVLIAVGEKIKMDDGPGSLVGGLTDASGSAVLEVFPGEIQMAIVSAPGFPPNFWDGAGRSAAMGQGMKGPPDAKVPEGRTTITFRMPRGVKLKGKVMDMEGGALAGVEVESLGFLGSGDKAVSGPDGVYELDVITAEFSMGVIARLPGWVQEKTESPDDGKGDPRPSAATEKTMDIRMRRAITVAGRVLDPEGRPVSGATVTVRPEKKEGRFDFDMGRMLGGHASSITLANGTYAVDGVPSEGKVRVFARREGFVDGGTEAFEVGKDLVKAPDVHLLAGATLAVKVLGPDGQGVGGARVRVEVERADKVKPDDWESMMERDSGAQDVRTSAAGTAEVPLLPPGKATVRVTAAGFAPSGAKLNIAPEAGPKEPVTVRLKPGIVVSGRVVDGDGHPLEGAVVRVENRSERQARRVPAPGEEEAETQAEEEDWVSGWDRSRRAVSDVQGQWSVKDLPDRKFDVRASKDGYGGFNAQVGEDRARVEVRLVKQDPEAVKRIAEIDKEMQALYGQMGSLEGEAQQALFKQIRELQQERERLSSDGK